MIIRVFALTILAALTSYNGFAAIPEIGAGCTVPPRTGDRIVVQNAQQLNAALAKANPGDRIILSDGLYAGNFVLSRSGAPSEPIVVRARRKMFARIDGTLTLAGRDTWAYGLMITGKNAQVTMTGERSRLIRSKISGRRDDPKSQSGSIMIGMMGRDQHLGCNDISDTNGRGISTSTQKSTGARIYRNYIHDQYVSPTYKNQRAHEALQLGQTQGVGVDGATCRIPLNASVHHNLFYRWNHSGDSENETISIKSSSNNVYQNTMIQTRLIMNRFGYNNVIQSNWIEQGNTNGLNGIAVKGDNTKVIGNTIKLAANAGIFIQTGNQTMDGRGMHRSSDVPPGAKLSTVWDNTTDNPIARNTLVAGNNAPVISVGRPAPEGNSLVETRKTRLEGNTGQIETAKNYIGKWDSPRKGNLETTTTYSPTTTQRYLAAEKLSLSDVGPDFVPAN
ncbi:MAG: chondroitinase-B domain-containing protein [Rickettsiales bacterium]